MFSTRIITLPNTVLSKYNITWGTMHLINPLFSLLVIIWMYGYGVNIDLWFLHILF